VLISWATSANVASIARGCGVGERRRAVRLARRGRLPADVLALAITPPRGDCHAHKPPTTGSSKPDHPSNVGRARASFAQRPQGGRARRFRELLPAGVEDEAVVMVGGCGQAE